MAQQLKVCTVLQRTWVWVPSICLLAHSLLTSEIIVHIQLKELIFLEDYEKLKNNTSFPFRMHSANFKTRFLKIIIVNLLRKIC